MTTAIKDCRHERIDQDLWDKGCSDCNHTYYSIIDYQQQKLDAAERLHAEMLGTLYMALGYTRAVMSLRGEDESDMLRAIEATIARAEKREAR